MQKKKNERSPIKANGQMQKVHNSGLKTGHAQAFGAVRMLAEYLEWKAIQSIVDDRETLENMGYSTIDEYFTAHNIKRSTAFKNLKIARKLSAEEVQLCGQIGLTRTDLFTYAYLPEDQRLQIKDGKVLNLETTDKDEIKYLIKQLIQENKEARESAQKAGTENKALRRTVEDLNARIPSHQGLGWAWEAVERINLAISEIQSNMHLLLDSKDHRLVDNPELKAKVSGLYQAANQMLTSVFDRIEKLTGYHPGREGKQ